MGRPATTRSSTSSAPREAGSTSRWSGSTPSLPWEHPDSLDPEIRVIAPDGFVYENLLALDDRESLDLDASLHDALLPQTGVYVIAASTTRGHGAYRLTFQAAEVAPVGSGDRVIPTGGDCETVLVGGASRGTSLVLDPLGQPLSGAEVTWNASPGDGETGTVRFEEGTLAETSVDGFARARVTHLTRGKVRFGPVVSNPVIASWVVVREEPAFRAETAPRYAPAGSWPLRILDVGPGASLRLTGPPPTEIRTHRPRARAESRLGVVESRPAPASKGLVKARAAGTSTPEFGVSQGSGGSGIRPDAATAEPLPSLVAPLSPGPCVAPGGRTSKYAVEAAELRPPYTLTLTNEETQQPVGEAGIEDARIESTLTFRLAILDGNQLPPTHPILVRFRVGGPRHGTLILDPGGLRTECPEGSFVWHDVDAEGHLIPNEIFEYRLGTLARYVGVEPDPEHPGQVRPVWGTAEALELQLVVESPTGVPLFSRTFEVHAKPGKPDHFVLNGPADPPHTFRVWPDYHAFPSGTKQGGGTRLAAGFSMAQVTFLEDRYGNKLWGYGATTVVPTDPRVQATFTSQAQSGEEYIGYRLDTTWNDDPEMPDGNVPVTLGVNYNDPDEAIGSGQVTQPITYLFQRGMMKAVERRPSYDRVRPDGTIVADDGTFPMTVSPEAGSEGLPKTEAGDTRRLVLLTLSGHGISGVVPSPEPYPNGHKTWKQVADPGGSGTWHWEPDQVLTGLDPFHETGEPAAFRMTLVDGYGRVAEDGRFVVHRCPRWDHDSPNAPDQPGRECTLAPLDSGGTRIIERVEVNPSAEPLDHRRGYMGIELVKAPTNPGTYYVKLEALDGAPWRISRQSDMHSDETAAGQYQGGFALCTVRGGEFLDQNFQRIKPLVARTATPAYLRIAVPGSSTSALNLNLHDYKNDGTEFGTAVPITMNRVGKSDSYLGRLTLLPEGDTPPAARRTLAGTEDPVLAISACSSTLTATAGTTEVARDPAALNCKLKIEWVSPEAPSTPRDEQYTVIEDRTKNYAEKTYLRLAVINPHKNDEVVPQAGLRCAWLREVPIDGSGGRPAQVPSVVFSGSSVPNPNDNNAAQGGDVLDSPGLSVTMIDGVSMPREGEPAFFLRAVARRRTNSAGGFLQDFSALLFAQACQAVGLVEDSESRYLDMWVDQVEYFPQRTQPSRHPSLNGAAKLSIDWIEKEALDVLESATPGEADAFRSVETVWSDGYNPGSEGQLAVTGQAVGCGSTYVSPSDLSLNHRIHMNPFAEGLRWGYLGESASPGGMVLSYMEAGMKYTVGPGRFAVFENLISHEARHSLQNKLNAADLPSNDSDHDYFVTSLSGNGVALNGGERMLDVASTAGGGWNPEFSLHGNDAATISVGEDCHASKQAFERDAILNSRSFTNGAFPAGRRGAGHWRAGLPGWDGGMVLADADA